MSSLCSYVRCFNEEDALCEAALTPANAQTQKNTELVCGEESIRVIEPVMLNHTSFQSTLAVCQNLVNNLKRRHQACVCSVSVACSIFRHHE